MKQNSVNGGNIKLKEQVWELAPPLAQARLMSVFFPCLLVLWEV